MVGKVQPLAAVHYWITLIAYDFIDWKGGFKGLGKGGRGVFVLGCSLSVMTGRRDNGPACWPEGAPAHLALPAMCGF